MGFFWTIVTLVVALGLAWRYLGSYMVAVFDGRVHFLGFIERPVYRVLGTSPEQEQNWKRYATSLVIFSAVAFGITYLLIRIQGSLPLNPQHLGAVPQALSFNTAASFLTNTNWQNYGGETTMSYFSQIGALTVEQLSAPAVGIAVAMALIRGLLPPQLDRPRQLLGRHDPRHPLHPASPSPSSSASSSSARAPCRPWPGTVSIHDALNGVDPDHRPGPDRPPMEAIKQLGTNGGGFLNANSAHPFENPTGLTNCSRSSCCWPSRSP